MSNELQGRVIAITGATGGIGRAVALAAVRAGAELVVLGRNVPRLQALHAELESLAPGAALMAQLDLENALANDYDRIADAVLTRYGRLDGLVHCAGMLGSLTPIDQYDVPTWCRVMQVNVTAAFALTQVLLPALRQSADASVIFTSSGVGRKGRAYWGAYAVSKFAIEGFMQVLAAETSGNSRVRVNTLNPGRARTAMRRTAYWGAYAVSKFAIEGFMQVLAAETSGNSRVRVNTLNPGRARTTMRRSAYPSENLESLPLPESLVDPYLRLLGPRGAGVTGQALDCQ